MMMCVVLQIKNLFCSVLNLFLRRRLEHSHKDHEFAPKVSGKPCSEHPAFFSALSLHGGLDLEPAHCDGIHAVLKILGQNSTAASDARGGLGRKTRAGAGR